MNTKVTLLGAGVLIAGGLVLAGWGWQRLETQPKSGGEAAAISLQGRYERHLFTITGSDKTGERTAIFSSVLVDDAAVVGTLREIIRVAYKDNSVSKAQPVVEVVDERNYVTMFAEGGKVYFQLFKNSRGEVGSVQFWQDNNLPRN